MNSVPADAVQCPNCGYNGKQQNDPYCLPIGYRLVGRFVIGMKTAEDGDSASYIGFDCSVNRLVTVREFLPWKGCVRNPETYELYPRPGAELHYKTSLMDFSDLYKNLRKIVDQPGIIRIVDFFEANGTAYAISEVFDGITLREFLSMAGGTISCEQATKLLEPVFNAVEAIHAVNLIHRGISPDTIYLNRNGDVRLGGFATSQVRTRGTEVANKIFSGYAAPEQYSTTMWQGTATDVYALASVFYRCVTGITPPDAEQRRGYDTLEPMAQVREGVSPFISHAISLGMLINTQERTQYTIDLLSALKNPAPPIQSDYSPRSAAYEEEYYDEGEEEYYDDEPYDDEPYDEEDYDDGYYEESRRRPAPRKKKSRNRKGGYPAWIEQVGVRNFWMILCFLAVLAIAIVCIAVYRKNYIKTADTIDFAHDRTGVTAVPEYLGLTEKETYDLIDRSLLKYEFIDVYINNKGQYWHSTPDENGFITEVTLTPDNASEEVGTVIKQEPAAGESVESGGSVKIYVYKGRRVIVPNVVGMYYTDAYSRFAREGIKYTSRMETSAGIPGLILRQSFPMGAMAAPDDVVVLTIAEAPYVPPEEDEEEEEEEDEEEDGGDEGGGASEGAYHMSKPLEFAALPDGRKFAVRPAKYTAR